MTMLVHILAIARQRANECTWKALGSLPRWHLFSPWRNRLKILLLQKIFYLYFKVKNRVGIKGIEHLRWCRDAGEPVLVVANHSGTVDVVFHQALHAHYNHLVYTFVSSGAFHTLERPVAMPVFPAVHHVAELIPRHGPGSKSVQRMIDRLRHGDHVFLYPEGTFNRGLVVEGFTGVARVAHGYRQRTGKDLMILPSCTIGMWTAYHPEKLLIKKRGGKGQKMQGWSKIVVGFGKPFTLSFPEEPTKEDYRAATSEVMHRIATIWGQKRIRPSIKRARISNWATVHEGGHRSYPE